METRSKRQRLILVSSNVPPQRPNLPAIFESLNDDTLTTVLEFVGGKSYRSFGGVNKHCKEVYLNTEGMTKETFLFGYGPLSAITDRYERDGRYNWILREALYKGVLFYNRKDVLEWALKERKTDLLMRICNVAGEEGRIDLLYKVWNYIDDYEDDKENIFGGVGNNATNHGQLNVLKWLESKGFYIDKYECAAGAARGGYLHIIQWLKEEKALQLHGELYYYAIDGGGQLHVMKWLREQEVDWSEEAFPYAANKGNLNILQWLHDEGCPWPEDESPWYRVYERRLKPEVRNWLRTNGYIDRIIFGDDDDY